MLTAVKRKSGYSGKKGILDTECNVQFGEGGAGTFSDGKLNTGVNNPLSKTVFEEFVRHGAPEEIMYEAKPHIGTDKIIRNRKEHKKRYYFAWRRGNIRSKILRL